MNEIKQKIIQFIDKQGISKREFCKNISVSPPYFSNDSAVGSDVMTKIFINYPEINFDWVITGRGEMLLSNSPKNCNKCEDLEKKYSALLEKYTQLSDKTVMLQEEQVQYLKKQQLVK